MILRGFSDKKASTELEEARHWDSVEASQGKLETALLERIGLLTVDGLPVNAKPRGDFSQRAT
ncbi:hypothetical protein DSCO28_40840 [Desulfosarcina ovata subsp. sediminis]|uniref:Uncharacterized protein n=1 Tax=Desulfosarcina ovata subsp. sediminis TaxID=885957 RepID=A0A5K7ZTI7_9BACT|nr:hypothetical protein [Desulfosarcina ovata]BBO83518.1 hypothetical protein DSCO28_40840 [Desulfosarcina ovata subsp. sediminis]